MPSIGGSESSSSPEQPPRKRQARSTTSAADYPVPETGGDDEPLFPQETNPSNSSASSRHGSHTNDKARKDRITNFNKNFADRRDTDVQASLAALPFVVQQRKQQINKTLQQLKDDIKEVGPRLTQCANCGNPRDVDTTSKFDVTIVARDFVHRDFAVYKYIRCTSNECRDREPELFNPLSVGYFPANPKKQVRCSLHISNVHGEVHVLLLFCHHHMPLCRLCHFARTVSVCCSSVCTVFHVVLILYDRWMDSKFDVLCISDIQSRVYCFYCP